MSFTPINPGILATVEWLNRHGFRTTDSGDGDTHDHECDQPVPYVHMQVYEELLVAEANRLKHLLAGLGIHVQPMDEHCTVPSIEASYNPADGYGGVITLWNVKLPTVPVDTPR